MAVNPVTNTIYVANNCADSSCSTSPTITAINGSTLATTAVSVCGAGQNPGDVEVNTVTNKIYIPCEDFTSGQLPGQTVYVIDGATNTTFPIAIGDQPNSSTVNSVTNTIYTPNLNDNTISVIGGNTKAQLNNVTPCRLVDTRPGSGGSGPSREGPRGIQSAAVGAAEMHWPQSLLSDQLLLERHLGSEQRPGRLSHHLARQPDPARGLHYELRWANQGQRRHRFRRD